MSIKKTARILLLEDDQDLRELLQEYYEPRGYQIISHDDPTTPLRELEGGADASKSYDLVLTDLMMPNLNGIEFIARMKKLAPKIPIILMTAHSSVEIAVEAIEAGAYDFVVKPLHFPQLNVSIERALRWSRLQEENHTLRTAVKSVQSFEGVVGKSQAIQRVFDLAKRVANSTATVLIHGESGTGKEVVARAIHQHGTRKDQAFIAINCSAIPENLLESELFGHAKGAFTGAVDKKIGLFEEADGGTLFLDEIGDLNATLQAKLLRVLQERKIKRIGENVFRPVNVRILCATHKNLSVEVQEKRFREDLFFRLNVIPINIPPLRDRKEDILPLAEHFLRRFSVQNGVDILGFTPAANHHLLKLQWRGNVRELENAVERAVVLCTSNRVDDSDLFLADTLSSGTPEFTTNPSNSESSKNSNSNGLEAANMNGESDSIYAQSSSSGSAPVSEANVANSGNAPRDRVDLSSLPVESLPTLAQYDLEYISFVLKAVKGVKEQAARVLNLDRKTLYRRIREIEEAQAQALDSENSDSSGDTNSNSSNASTPKATREIMESQLGHAH